MSSSLGLYISVPFCRAKCSYCNFASDVYGEERIDAYLLAVLAEIAAARQRAFRAGAELPDQVDSIYLGGGTPSLLSALQLRTLFEGVRQHFLVSPSAEITLECAPGQLEEKTLDEFQRQGGNRVSLGVQSFIDRESRSVGRTHSRQSCLGEITRLRASGISNLNVDLIAGLPHQTETSWRESVEVAIGTEVPHLSLYMLEVDDDSRLGREMISAGQRYGAGNTPSEDEVADSYLWALDRLATAGVQQYEISNFARDGFRSHHNMKYWQRLPYLGFGLDAHSMLLCDAPEAVRWANPDELERYMQGANGGSASGLNLFGAVTQIEQIHRVRAFEETIFLGLRMNRGLDLTEVRSVFGEDLAGGALAGFRDSIRAGLLEEIGQTLRLTDAGRLLSNEVFGQALAISA